MKTATRLPAACESDPAHITMIVRGAPADDGVVTLHIVLGELTVRSKRILLLAACLTLAAASGARAQHLTINGGAYRQASDFVTLKNGAKEIDLDAGTTFALGANLELGPLRVTTAYVSGAKLSRKGVTGKEKIGEGTLLAASADLLMRPIPRIIGLQPYLLGGVGLKRNSYEFEDAGLLIDFKDYKSKSDLALHWGLGADFMLGGIGVMAEISDFVTFADKKFGTHDAFGVIGLRLRLF